jgi:peptide deformylase
MRFQTPSGILTTKSFDGLTARVIQHEVDHLDGIPFINKANRYHREKAMKGYAYA